MPPLTASLLHKQIVAGDTAPLYMLVGEDDAEKSAVANEFVDMIDEGLRAFNVDRLYGAETKADELIDVASTLPMMAPRRLVLVFEAEKLLVPKRESKAADEEQDRLAAFLKSPPAHATIVFVCGPLDQRRKLVKLLIQTAQVVDCGSIENPAAAERWVKARSARLGITLDAAATRELVQRAGLDIVRLRAGLERLALYAMGEPKVTADDVRDVVMAGPEAAEDFGIANAIGNGDARTALQQLGAALDGGAVPFFLLGQIRFAAEKLPPSRVRQGIEAVFRTDLALKSSGGDPRMLLERLVVELCGDKPRPAPTYRGGRRY